MKNFHSTFPLLPVFLITTPAMPPKAKCVLPLAQSPARAILSSVSAILLHVSSVQSGNHLSSPMNTSSCTNRLTGNWWSPPRPVTPTTPASVMFDMLGQSHSRSVVTAEDPSQGGYSPKRGKSFDTTQFLPPILPVAAVVDVVTPWHFFPAQSISFMSIQFIAFFPSFCWL